MIQLHCNVQQLESQIAEAKERIRKLAEQYELAEYVAEEEADEPTIVEG